MLLHILLYLLCDTGCAAWLGVRVELGLEVFVSVVLVCRHPCCDASQGIASCETSPWLSELLVSIETRRCCVQGEAARTCWSRTAA